MAKTGKPRQRTRKAGRPANGTARPSINIAENPLNVLSRRHEAGSAAIISEEQFLAGDRLRTDYTLGRLEQHLTADWNWTAAGGAEPDILTNKVLAARQRLHAALDAVGPELAGILLEVCCLSAGLEQAERRLALPARSGKAVLHMALTGLARHYGLIAPSASRHPALRRWAQADYKPHLMA